MKTLNQIMEREEGMPRFLICLFRIPGDCAASPKSVSRTYLELSLPKVSSTRAVLLSYLNNDCGPEHF